MEEDSTKALSNVIRIDDERIQEHLGKIVRGSVEETLNALLDTTEETGLTRWIGAMPGQPDGPSQGWWPGLRFPRRPVGVKEAAVPWKTADY